MSVSLRDDAVTRVLRRLRVTGETEDPPAIQRVQSREAELGRRVYGPERSDLYGNAPLAISAEVGDLLYLLAITTGARTIVEFGASLGVSTIYLAAAIHDLGAGSLITTEERPDKARLAQANLEEAGLDHVVELRVGDALHTLEGMTDEVDLLFLDGWNELYLPVLDLIQPRLPIGALVIADLSRNDPHHQRYRDQVHDLAHGYFSIDIPLDAGVVISRRVTPS